MHDEMLSHFDDCIARMLLLRDRLSAARRVEPGERHETVLAAIAVAERFAHQADQTLTKPFPPVREPSRALTTANTAALSS
ncbi:hypothetical protein [Actinoplanes derwentensis]|uniref:Uncharacterized protein n=1 Tax=Actinoplanes derwentensis TaxID=113562 RepID=A0A1H2AQP0_9ACTN|nr:hypothetical protein [Actinoplanes derwentensis]GID84392.1 hypothetical protein Ade03nite_33160 [Actinoplanes derwentensis]SDT48129.1 hypothetical protein SAMN04489716_4018 [Actinoplanes derwentensis]